MAKRIVGVVGAGAMGSGIAQVAAQAGHEVFIYDSAEGAAQKAHAKVGADLEKLVAKGKVTEADRASTVARIKPTSDLNKFKTTTLVIEAIVEDLAAKANLFRELEGVVPADAIITSNTSSLSITELAATIKDPARFAGLHFFNPAPVMPLVEVIRGIQTKPEVIDELVELVTGWGKTPVKVKSAPGFIVNKGARSYYGEALRCLEEGAADAATIDALFKANGFKMGPLELIDLVGLDINLAVSGKMMDAYHGRSRYAPSLAVEELVAAGHLGRKSGRGFYDHSSDAKPMVPLMPPAPKPKLVLLAGRVHRAVDPLIEMIEAANIPVVRTERGGYLEVDGQRLRRSYGRFAERKEVVFDFAFDYNTVSLIAIAGGEDANLNAIAGLFQALGKDVVQVANTPGMVVGKTLAMLVNEAFETEQLGIASREDIDQAMKLGLNFPGGPFEWAAKFKAGFWANYLSLLQATYGEERYSACMGLRRAESQEEKSYF